MVEKRCCLGLPVADGTAGWKEGGGAEGVKVQRNVYRQEVQPAAKKLSAFLSSPLSAHFTSSILSSTFSLSSSFRSTCIHLPSHQKMLGTLPRFPTVPAMLGSLPRAVNPPSLPRGLTMPSLPSMPRCVSLPRPAVMSMVSEAPRRLLQDCCSVLDHQSAAGNSRGSF